MKLAVIFPGIGYHTDKPLLYYAKKLAKAYGYEIREVPYGNFPKNVKGSEEKMKESFFSALAQSFEFIEQDGIVFCGTDDPWVKIDVIKKACEERKLPLHITEGADHSLETGKVGKDLENLGSIMEQSEEYIRNLV
ncbi:MAG: hypothetical protein J6K58_13875 [Lachnospiraceae bacterium]|nr:hypothetical protein [Lachnospiraceae bacterium]